MAGHAAQHHPQDAHKFCPSRRNDANRHVISTVISLCHFRVTAIKNTVG